MDDKRAVEINRAVDGMYREVIRRMILTMVNSEIHAARRRPLRDHKVSSPSTEVPPRTEYHTYESSEPAPISFPPPPNPNAQPLAGSPSSAGSRTASNALTRALNLASKKLFGTSSSPRSSPYYREYTFASPRRQQILSSRGGLGLDVEGVRDPQEDALLEGLEELAQKTEVLMHWGDEMYEYVRAVPQS